MIFGMVKGLVKSALFGAVVVTIAGGLGYWKVATAKLPAPAGAVVTTGVARGTPSLSGGTLPVTFEAYVKEAGRQNLLDSGGPAGLVSRRLEWSHGSFDWVEDTGFVERQAQDAAARKKLASREVGALIPDLRHADARVREVSARELHLRTGQAMGYAYDAPEADRAKAAEAWDRWWAVPDNRARYNAKRTLDFVDGALDTLRRAIGDGQPPATSAGASTGTSASAGAGRAK